MQQWYLSIYDRRTSHILSEGPLTNVTDAEVRAQFNPDDSDAIGGFLIGDADLSFVKDHSGFEVNLTDEVAFVELLEI